ncbi:toprim domain-containing protein [Psychromonas aquimarina]|uniref:toprim domain-containing protein n=1 Tax=Psychromonas aquimarina TaxID=444919 RepID=UPI000413088D|nr:toprim domain-containing protein [Psychromonas aquimarina]
MNKSDVVRKAAFGKWLSILDALFPQFNDAIKNIPDHVPCPVSGGSDGFRLFKDANETGGGISNTHGAFPDGFSLLMWACGWSFSETMNEIAVFLNIEDWKAESRVLPRKQMVIPKPKECDAKTLLNRRLKLRKLWNESYPINHTNARIAREYFAKRSIFISNDYYNNALKKTMRFHPSMEYWHKYKEIIDGKLVKKCTLIGKYFAIVNLVRYDNGSPASLHITYLNEKGEKLALNHNGKPIPCKKLMAACENKSISGGAIQLEAPSSNCLDLSEGIETGLAVHVAIGKPVWPCVSSTLLGCFNPPDGVDELNVWADLDRNKAGYLAALKLSERMKEINVKVNIFLPNHKLKDDAKSIDWNDVLAIYGAYEFHEMLAA